MPKQNPWALARPEWKTETRSFTDARHPGVDFTLTVRPLDGCELLLAYEKAEQMIETWLNGQNVYPNPMGGAPPKLSERLLQGVCLLELQQQQIDGSPYDPDNYYSADDLIGLAHNAANAWGKISVWSQGLLQKVDSEPGNGSGADARSSSAPSSTTDTSTPT